MAGHTSNRFSKKAMTTPVAMTLALMMVVAASTALSFWVTRLQGQQQGSVESSQSQLFENLASCIDIPQFDLNVLDNTSNVVLQNCGNKKLEVGDTVLQDNGVVSSAPCSFVINSTTCDKCPFTLHVNAIKDFKLIWNQTTCLANIDRGKKHQVTLYVDNKASRSKTFVPAATVACSVSLANTSTLSTSSVGASNQRVYNITITNTGNAQDTFTLANTTAGANCGGTRVKNANSSLVLITTIQLNGGTSAPLHLNQTLGGDASGQCNATLTATSTNCLSKTARIVASTDT